MLLPPLVAQRIIAPYPLVFGGPEVGFTAADAWYHIRHTQFAVTHFPRVLRYDSGTHYPTGEHAEHAGLFDVTTAAASIAAFGWNPTRREVETVAAIAPVIWGGLCFALLFALARAVGIFGSTFTWLFLLSPGLSLQPHLLGEFDHHAAELVLLPLCVFLLLVAFDERTSKPAAFWSGIGLVVYLLTWAGAPLMLLFLAVPSWVVFGATRGASEQAGQEIRLSLHFAGAALLFVAIGVLIPNWRMKAGFFWPSVVGLLLVAAVVRVSRSRSTFAAVSAVLAVAVVVAAASFDRVAMELSFALQRKPLTVQEHQLASFDTIFAWTRLTAPLALLSMPLAIVEVRRGRSPVSHLLVPLVGLGIVLLWLHTRDYGYHSGLWICLCAALSLHWVAGHLERTRLGAKARWVPALFIAIHTVAVALRWLPSPAFKSTELSFTANAGWSQALDWMKKSTPPYARPVTEASQPFQQDLDFSPDHYGVMVSWDAGHLLSYRAERTPVISGTPSAEWAHYFTSLGEEESLTRLCPRCGPSERVRYVVIDDDTATKGWRGRANEAGVELLPPTLPIATCELPGGTVAPVYGYGPSFDRSVVAGLYYDDGQDYPHYRLAYETPVKRVTAYVMVASGGRGYAELDSLPLTEQTSRLLSAGSVRTPEGCMYGARLVSALKVFEVVKGARLVGAAPPSTAVAAELQLEATTTHRVFRIERRALADVDGRFELIAAYATEPSPDLSVRAVGSWRVSSESGAVVEVAVTEEEIQRGVQKQVSF